MTAVLMQCGHPATGTHSGATGRVPVCAQCFPDDPRAARPQTDEEMKGWSDRLDGREAKCTCGRTLPSMQALQRYPSFEWRGHGSSFTELCVHCRHGESYHDILTGTGAPLCARYEPPEAAEFDFYACEACA